MVGLYAASEARCCGAAEAGVWAGDVAANNVVALSNANNRRFIGSLFQKGYCRSGRSSVAVQSGVEQLVGDDELMLDSVELHSEDQLLLSNREAEWRRTEREESGCRLKF
jgi:hypothetical protein